MADRHKHVVAISHDGEDEEPAVTDGWQSIDHRRRKGAA